MQMSIKYWFWQKEPYGKQGSFEYAIGDDDNDDIRPLCIKFLQMI